MPGASYAHIASDMPRSAGSDSPSDSVSSVRVASPPLADPNPASGFSWAVLVWRPKRVRPDETDRRLGPVRTAQAHVPAACLAWRIIFILVYRALGVSKRSPGPQALPPENAGLAPERLLCRPRRHRRPTTRPPLHNNAATGSAVSPPLVPASTGLPLPWHRHHGEAADIQCAPPLGACLFVWYLLSGKYKDDQGGNPGKLT